MREFRDNEGRPWQVALTVASALRVRDMVTVDVTVEEELPDGGVKTERKTVPFDMVDVASLSQTFQVLRGQFAKVGESLYAILAKQVEERKLTKDQFLDGLRGDSLEAGAKALEQELVDFFPQRLRRMVGLLAAKMDEVAGEMLDQAEAKMAEVTAGDLRGVPSGKPLASSASTPASGLSGNSPQPETPASNTTGGTPPT
jgi:hypothetical protein